MKIKKIRILPLAVGIMLLLSACGAKTPSGQASAGSGSGASQSSLSQADQSSGSGENSALAQDASQEQDGSLSDDESYAVAGSQTYDAMTQAGPEINEDSPEPENEDWTGTYEGESGEVLTISSFDGSSISFSFSVSGISSTAAVSGNEAVYHGDDRVDVIFTFFGDAISIGVVSQEDYDMSSSPLNGTYTRQ